MSCFNFFLSFFGHLSLSLSFFWIIYLDSSNKYDDSQCSSFSSINHMTRFTCIYQREKKKYVQLLRRGTDHAEEVSEAQCHLACAGLSAEGGGSTVSSLGGGAALQSILRDQQSLMLKTARSHKFANPPKFPGRLDFHANVPLFSRGSSSPSFLPYFGHISKSAWSINYIFLK